MYISNFSYFKNLGEWHCFVTYLSNDPHITSIQSYICLLTKSIRI